MTKSKGIATWIVILIFVFFFLFPMLSSFGGIFGGFVFIALVPLVIFIIIIYVVFSFVKNLPKTLEELNKTYDQKYEIPIEFFEQGKPAMGTSSDKLFRDHTGQKVLYYENGKPVYKKKEY